jgi:serine/threonine-protein kinase
MGSVWVADDPVLSRRVAVKILREDLAADDATRARFRNEALAAARLNHPNIVATYDTGDDDGASYIVMEFVDGPTLRHVIDKHGPLSVREAIRVGVQVAGALEAAHRAGLVHRDIKPLNVLVPATGPVKVTDFGVAKATDVEDLTRAGTVMGTARYLAPEQVNGRPADARTDVYALGLLLYEMLCARPPFGGDTDIATGLARLSMTAPAIRESRPDVPPALDHLVHRCLARDPGRRFQSAAEARDALATVAVDPRPVTAPGPAPASTTRSAARATAPAHSPPRRSTATTWFWVGVVFALAIAGVVVAILAVQGDAHSRVGPGPNAPSRSTSVVSSDSVDGSGASRA